MKRLVEFTSRSGGTITVEVDDSTPEGSIVPVGAGQTIAKASQSFEAALDGVRTTAESLLDRLRALADIPDEVAVEFGVKLGAEAGVILASGTAEANYKVSLKWKREERRDVAT